MSVPKSKVLSVSKGMMMLTELKHNSPSNSQTVCVNIQQPPPVPKASDIVPEISERSVEDVKAVYDPPQQIPDSLQDPPSNFVASTIGVNPYSEIPLDYQGTVESLLVLIRIFESNPLVVNKFIVASIKDLSELIQKLTGSDSVEIVQNYDVDCSCIGSEKFVYVEKIYVKTGSDVLNFKYAFPEAVKFLDEHNISIKTVC